jgi:hypothetical protein
VSPHTFPGRPPAGLPPYLAHGAVQGPPGWHSLDRPARGSRLNGTCRADLGVAPSWGENALVRVVVTRIEQDGTMQRRMVDTARHSDRRQWERLAGRALEFPPPHRPGPGIPVYHVSIGDRVILVAAHGLGGPARNLVTAVMALGEELLAR